MIDRNQLELIVEKILEELMEEKPEEKEDFFIVFPSPWTNIFYLLLEELDACKYNFIALVSDEIEEDKFEEIRDCTSIAKTLRYGKWDGLIKPSSQVFFSSIRRNDLIDIVNLREDSFETGLVKKCLTGGSQVGLWIRGLEKTSGREPAYYKEKLMSYHEEILRFGIKIVDTEVVK